MSFSELQTLLSSVCTETYHYAAPESVQRFIVWAEYGEIALYADDGVAISLPRVEIDVFTQTESDSLADEVQEALSAAGQTFTRTGPTFDDDGLTLRTVFSGALC